jgi:hypothetical protein
VQLSVPEIDRALERAARGVDQYCWIMQQVRAVDVSTDARFQRWFNAFYRVRKGGVWRRIFYALLERAKSEPLTFSEALVALEQELGRVEVSFASKLVATLDPDLPVVDRHVIRNFGLRRPSPGARDRMTKEVAVYLTLRQRVADLLAGPDGRRMCDRFRAHFPHVDVTDVKKVDFVMWQHRPAVPAQGDRGAKVPS